MVGSGGAGKTTLARAMGRALDIPVVHLDREYWLPGWAEPSNDAWDATLERLCAADSWVMDGNYGRTLPLRLRRAQAVVFMDFPPWRCVLGVIRRRWTSAFRHRPDLPTGVNDQISLDFLHWIWAFPHASRPRLEAALAGSDAPVFRLRTRREVADFLEALGH